MLFLRGAIKRRTFLVATLTALVVIVGCIAIAHCYKKLDGPFLGFFYGNNLLVNAGQRTNWPGIRAGVSPLDEIRKVNGREFQSGSQLNAYLLTLPANASLDIELYRSKKGLFAVQYSMPQFALDDYVMVFVLPSIFGVLLLVMGCFVFFKRPRYQISLVYFFFCATMALACLTLFEIHSSYNLKHLQYIHPFIAAVSLHLFTFFPERLRSKTARRFIASNYLFVFLLTALQLLTSTEPQLVRNFADATTVYILTVIIVDIGLLFRLYLKTTSSRSRDKAKMLFFGFSAIIILVTTWAFGFLVHRRIFFLDEALGLFLLFPLFFGYAIIQKHLFDIDRIIRLTISYALLGGLLLGIFVAVETFLGRFAPQSFLLHSPVTLIVIAILAGLTISKSFDFVQNTVTRVMFSGRYNIITTLRDITEKLSRVSQQEAIQSILVEDLVARLKLTGGTFLSNDNSLNQSFQVERAEGMSQVDIGSLDWSDISRRLEGKPTVFTTERLIEERLLVSSEIQCLKRNNIRTFVFVPMRNESLSILLLGGEVRGDYELKQETLDLLKTLGNQIAVSLENARLNVEHSHKDRLAALGKVASMIIHEIKNPLGVIKLSSETIKKRFAKGDNHYELAQMIEDEVTRMNNTVYRFLTFAKPGPLYLDRIDVDQLVKSVSENFRSGISSSHIQFETELHGTGELLAVDESKLRSILLNLLINAQDAVEDSERQDIKISTAVEDRSYRIWVSDSGPGMDAKIKNRIFQPFFTTKMSGAGLGLAIVKQFVQEHKGSIEVESSPGEGTCFSVCLPM